MPKKREGETQCRKHIWIFENDWDELVALYGDTIGPSKFIRLVVRQALKKVREKTNVKPSGTTKPIDIDGDILGDHTS